MPADLLHLQRLLPKCIVSVKSDSPAGIDLAALRTHGLRCSRSAVFESGSCLGTKRCKQRDSAQCGAMAVVLLDPSATSGYSLRWRLSSLRLAACFVLLRQGKRFPVSRDS